MRVYCISSFRTNNSPCIPLSTGDTNALRPNNSAYVDPTPPTWIPEERMIGLPRTPSSEWRCLRSPLAKRRRRPSAGPTS